MERYQSEGGGMWLSKEGATELMRGPTGWVHSMAWVVGGG
jgi:hypothetical protein